MDSINQKRLAKGVFSGRDQHSPLTREQKRNFKGLLYFPETSNLRFETAIDRFEEPQEINVYTSTGDTAARKGEMLKN